MLDALDDKLLGCRDRALLLVGFAGGFRRSELVSLDVGDIRKPPMGWSSRSVGRKPIRKEGEYRGPSLWLDRGDVPGPQLPCLDRRRCDRRSGPAFRSVDRHGRVSRGRMNAGSVARLIKRAADAAGLEPASYAGHSLRAGFATQAFLQWRRRSVHHAPNSP